MPRLHLNGPRAGFLALAASAFLASCVVVDDGPRPLPPRPGPGGPVMCTQEYDPVCGQIRGQRQTFGNACTARADGAEIIHRGECRGGGGGGSNWDRPRPDGSGWNRPGQGRPQACTREYRPVCAVRGNRQQTFGNACEAESAGWRIRRNGAC